VLIWDVARILSDPAPQEPVMAEQIEERGTPVPEKAKVYVVLDKNEYYLGENVFLKFCVENTGEGLVNISLGGDYRGASRHLRYKVKATDEEGKAVDDPDPSGFCMGGIGGGAEIKPGEKHCEA